MLTFGLLLGRAVGQPRRLMWIRGAAGTGSIVLGAAIFWGAGWVATAGHVVFWVTLAAHLAEFVVKRPVMEAAGGSMGHHFMQTLIYGLFHWTPIKQRLEAEEAAPQASGPPSA